MAGFSSAFLCQNLFFFIHAVTLCLRSLFSFISTYILRWQEDGSSSLDKIGEEIDFLETEELDAPELKDEIKAAEICVFNEDVVEEEKTEFYFNFKFPTYDEFRHLQCEAGNLLNSDVVPPATVSKCQFTSGKSRASVFTDEAETFSVKEGEIDVSLVSEEIFIGRNLEEDFHQTECMHDKGKEVVISDAEEDVKIGENGILEKSEEIRTEGELVDEYEFAIEKNYVIFNSDSESSSLERTRSVMNHLVDSYSEGFLSDGDFGGDLGVDDENEMMDSDTDLSGFEDDDVFDDEDSDIMQELKELEDNVNSPDGLKSDFHENLGNINDGFVTNEDKEVNWEDSSEKLRSKGSSVSDSQDANKLESLWEHQELIEQLKMELKKVKATGLPTILEESESPKISEDLKPWRIDEFQREDSIGELHKFYKSYRERMRKFDIINYQKMYAMGFLQLKDPLQSMSKQKQPPTLKSLVSQNIWLSKHKIHGSDPMKKFIKELQGDLEAVYVGQMCLSWEFLHWQYEKAWDLWDSDPRGRRRYNEVAGEFQQFQVLMHRFVEDELFQGPRVQNYVKSRCAVRNLLQVPVIREDNLKDKRKAEKGDIDDYVITTDMLVEIVEESIRTFWRFVRADKDCSAATINSSKKLPELPSPEDHKLVVEIRKDLQKKERRLKDLLRSENCILRKFRRYKEDDSDQVLYFFSQVDMKLVSRVLNMSKVTKEQLMWCHNKLGTISFVNRKKIHVEPAFLLFPC